MAKVIDSASRIPGSPYHDREEKCTSCSKSNFLLQRIEPIGWLCCDCAAIFGVHEGTRSRKSATHSEIKSGLRGTSSSSSNKERGSSGRRKSAPGRGGRAKSKQTRRKTIHTDSIVRGDGDLVTCHCVKEWVGETERHPLALVSLCEECEETFRCLPPWVGTDSSADRAITDEPDSILSEGKRDQDDQVSKPSIEGDPPSLPLKTPGESDIVETIELEDSDDAQESRKRKRSDVEGVTVGPCLEGRGSVGLESEDPILAVQSDPSGERKSRAGDSAEAKHDDVVESAELTQSANVVTTTKVDFEDGSASSTVGNDNVFLALGDTEPQDVREPSQHCEQRENSEQESTADNDLQITTAAPADGDVSGMIDVDNAGFSEVVDMEQVLNEFGLSSPEYATNIAEEGDQASDMQQNPDDTQHQEEEKEDAEDVTPSIHPETTSHPTESSADFFTPPQTPGHVRNAGKVNQEASHNRDVDPGFSPTWLPRGGRSSGTSQRTIDELKKIYKCETRLEVRFSREWYAATVLKVNGWKIFVTYDGWDAKYNEWIDINSERLRELPSSSSTTIDPLAAEQSPKKDAKASGLVFNTKAEKDGDGIRGRFWSSTREKNVETTNREFTIEQLKTMFIPGTAVEVLWGRHQWYSGRVTQAKGWRVLIHYDGWDHDHDHWLEVNSERLRHKTGQSETGNLLSSKDVISPVDSDAESSSNVGVVEEEGKVRSRTQQNHPPPTKKRRVSRGSSNRVRAAEKGEKGSERSSDSEVTATEHADGCEVNGAPHTMELDMANKIASADSAHEEQERESLSLGAELKENPTTDENTNESSLSIPSNTDISANERSAMETDSEVNPDSVVEYESSAFSAFDQVAIFTPGQYWSSIRERNADSVKRNRAQLSIEQLKCMFVPGTAVEVLWGRHHWYAGQIVEAKGWRVLVHYEGWDASHDHWIDINSERLRKKGGALDKDSQSNAAIYPTPSASAASSPIVNRGKQGAAGLYQHSQMSLLPTRGGDANGIEGIPSATMEVEGGTLEDWEIYCNQCDKQLQHHRLQQIQSLIKNVPIDETGENPTLYVKDTFDSSFSTACSAANGKLTSRTSKKRGSSKGSSSALSDSKSTTKKDSREAQNSDSNSNEIEEQVEIVTSAFGCRPLHGSVMPQKVCAFCNDTAVNVVGNFIGPHPFLAPHTERTTKSSPSDGTDENASSEPSSSTVETDAPSTIFKKRKRKRRIWVDVSGLKKSGYQVASAPASMTSGDTDTLTAVAAPSQGIKGKKNQRRIPKKRIFWAHDACARFSPEVHAADNGEWYNVWMALKRARNIKCALCKQRGATVGLLASLLTFNNAVISTM
ncbi:hypothetical protein HK102_005955 [Quaeritorhiza haematococci]|nr:hypothetical protein HK102_005955 [Quaeritorhiza haematococci]